MNGAEWASSTLVEEATLFLGRKPVTFHRLKSSISGAPVLGVDGYLGNDVTLAGVLHLDFMAGRVSFSPYEGAR